MDRLPQRVRLNLRQAYLPRIQKVSRERTAFIERLAAAPFQSRLWHHYDDGPEEQKLQLAALLSRMGQGAHLYVCGPTPFLEFVRQTAVAQGWPPERVHFESFTAIKAATAGDTAFEVELASTGTVYTIPEDQTVLSYLLSKGVDIPWSCEQGICGACLTRVVSGEPDHRDQYLTPEERARNDLFTPCCSRARGKRLVIDL